MRRLLDTARHLRSPQSELLGQGVRFAIAGGAVAAIFMATTTTLSEVAGLPFQLALAVGFAMAVIAHFSFQRFFVWVHHGEFALTLRRQVGRYTLVLGTQYVTTVLVTSFLPSSLHVRTIVVYVVWTAVISVINFVIFGRGVFHGERPTEGETG